MNNIPPVGPPPPSSPQNSLGPWPQLLKLWSEIRGYLFDLQSELNSPDPDWNKIESDLTHMLSDTNSMIGIVEKNHLAPISDPQLLTQLKEMSYYLTEIQRSGHNISEIIPLLKSFDNLFAIVYQALLQ